LLRHRRFHLHFKASGAAVYLVDFDGDEVEKAAAELGARAVSADVKNLASSSPIPRAAPVTMTVCPVKSYTRLPIP
jgi:hypothetical protein